MRIRIHIDYLTSHFTRILSNIATNINSKIKEQSIN